MIDYLDTASTIEWMGRFYSCHVVRNASFPPRSSRICHQTMHPVDTGSSSHLVHHFTSAAIALKTRPTFHMEEGSHRISLYTICTTHQRAIVISVYGMNTDNSMLSVHPLAPWCPWLSLWHLYIFSEQSFMSMS
ncbi:predicted protein [Lichtheimia corymbifera JMRC:FSU:9682]|uniref:Uncharacterized protein n=1 Tax=Lichtheimia corymbifera JMRC:FSU:9682 TaxID=1263082 RepID=A0A068SAF8_9FUNG|nr:predicted protein [Lichtheimia corymbifera JMRC:FSU:9682]